MTSVKPPMDIYERLMYNSRRVPVTGPTRTCKKQHGLTNKLVYSITSGDLSEPVFPDWYKPTGEELELTFCAGPETMEGFIMDRPSDMPSLTKNIFSDIPGIMHLSAHTYQINAVRFKEQTGTALNLVKLAAIIAYRMECSGIKAVKSMEPEIRDQLLQVGKQLRNNTNPKLSDMEF